MSERPVRRGLRNVMSGVLVGLGYGVSMRRSRMGVIYRAARPRKRRAGSTGGLAKRKPLTKVGNIEVRARSAESVADDVEQVRVGRRVVGRTIAEHPATGGRGPPKGGDGPYGSDLRRWLEGGS